MLSRGFIERVDAAHPSIGRRKTTGLESGVFFADFSDADHRRF